MNILREKQKLLPLSGYMGGDSGGGGGGTTQQQNQYSSLSPWIAPYIGSMLGAAQQQVFNVDQSGGITGIRPYSAYGSYNPQTGGQYGMTPSDVMAAQSSVAGFSPLQQRVQQDVANLQMPGAYQQAGQAAGAGTLGSFGAAGQAGQYGRLGAQAGLSYGQQATNPYAVQAYMNPYLEASLAPQIEMANRAYGQQAAQQASQATQAGAFGGSRFGVQQAQNELNRNLALQNLVGQGYNQAFNTAQQNMQQAAQLGMQGAGMGLQGVSGQLAGYGQGIGGAGAMANIAGQGLQAQQGILGLQAQTGAQQQQQQQNIINQAMQNYATAQQYPMSQLQQLKSLTVGLPIADVTTTQQSAAPSTASAIAGLGTTGIAGLGLYNALGGSSSSNPKS